MISGRFLYDVAGFRAESAADRRIDDCSQCMTAAIGQRLINAR
jgi:hypothetical protein